MTGDTYELPHPTCPGCAYEMTTDEMVESSVDLFQLAVEEHRAVVKCPGCDMEYWVKGGWKPHFSTSFAEETL